jgi:flagellar biogenesis protein FliO
MWGQFISVSLVLCGLLLLIWWLRSKGLASFAGLPRRPALRAKSMKVIERVPVSGQHSLLLIEVDNTRMLVCLSPGGSSVTSLKQPANDVV